MLAAGDGRFFNKEAVQIILKLAAGNKVSKVIFDLSTFYSFVLAGRGGQGWNHGYSWFLFACVFFFFFCSSVVTFCKSVLVVQLCQPSFERGDSSEV